MIAQLLKKKTDEIKHKDFCADDLNINQLETEKKDRAKSGLKAKNLSRTSSIQTRISFEQRTAATR